MRVSADGEGGARAGAGVPTGFLAGAACVLVVLAVAIGAAWVGVRRADERADVRSQVAAAEAAHRLDTGIAQPSRDLFLLAELAALKPVWAGYPAQLRDMLGQSLAGLPAFAWLAFANLDGQVRATTDDRQSGASVVGRSWFRSGLIGPLASESDNGDADPRWSVEVAVPVRDGGRVVGVLCGQLDATWIASLLDGVAPPAEPGQAPMVLQVLSAAGRPVLGGSGRSAAAGAQPGAAGASSAATGQFGGSGLRWTVLAREDRHVADAAFAAAFVLTLVPAGIVLAWLLTRRQRGAEPRPEPVATAPDAGRFTTQIESLRQLADADLMTGLLNRRGFLKASSRPMAESAARGLLIVDIDDLGTVNERLGHATGDSVICAVAAAVQGMVRQSDLVGRLGGEEFAVLVSGDADRLRLLAERIRCASQQFVTTSDAVVTVTVSIGGVVWDTPEIDLPDVLERADAALCRAKEGGRNCIRVERIAATDLHAG